MLSRWLPDIVRNPVSIIGAGITTIAAGLFLFVFLADLFGIHTNPYLGMVFFLIMPGLFVFGLLLIPIGVFYERRRRAKGHAPAVAEWPTLDLTKPHTRRVAAFVFGLTLVNILIVSLAAYRGLEYMDSVSFCGQLCHAVMEPEFVAYQNGPHSRVRCVGCHIGEGASWFVRSKLSGTRQIFAVMFNTYERPVPTPVHDLRPARETCEQCHWPDQFHGDKIEVVREYAEDEANTMTETSLQLHVGGATGATGRSTGIHWHTSQNHLVEYVATDDKRQVIPYVRLTDRSAGTVKEYVVEGTNPGALAGAGRRQMDCVDCHNRPTHVFFMTAERAMNVAMASGDIPADLPYVRREGAAVLKVEYRSRDEAMAEIARTIRAFYQENHAEVASARRADVDRAVAGLQTLYARNVFPAMRVTWGTHLNNRGHMDAPGCFRCHDDLHKTSAGEVIRQDCDLCHAMQ
jgi:hypothetical protein